MAGVDKLQVAMLGGDERELILLRALLAEGFRVTVAGYPDLPEISGARRVNSAVAAVSSAQAVIAPMSNTDEFGVIKAHLDPEAHLLLDEEVFSAIPQGTPLLIGIAKPVIEALAARYDVRLIQLAEMDEIAVLNSIPTAEGAIERAMSELPITLHGSRSIVVGYGRCAITLARMLHGIGSRVRVIARDRGQLARAFETGLDTGHLSELKQWLPEAQVVFNTVPAMVLDREALETLPTDGLVIDIASAPGGTDFDAAKEMGIKAFLDLGIPGKVAPVTAGEVLARTVPPLIKDLVDTEV